MKELCSAVRTAAEILISQLPDSDVYKQFQSCNVVCVRLVDAPSTARGRLAFSFEKVLDGKDKWIIELNKDDPLDVWMLTIGHEFAHTFTTGFDGDLHIEWALGAIFCRNYGGFVDDDLLSGAFTVAEVLADSFAREWLNRRNNRAEVVELLNLLREKKEIFFGRPLE